MDGFQLHSSLLDYDPEEEERQRTAAFAALAAQRTPDDSAMSPGQLELQPEFQPEPSVDAISALAMAGGAPTRVDDPVQLVPEAPARIEAEVPTVPGDAEAFQADEAAAQVAEPTKGLDSPARSPEMKEAAPAASPVTPTATSPVGEMKTADPPPQQDPFEALMLRGEEQRRKQLEAYDKEGPPGINGWALLADVAFNKGKSIPNMLAQVDADKRSYREGRQRLLTSGHADPVNQMIAMGNLQARQATGARLSDKDRLAAEQDQNARTAFMSSWGKYMSPEEQEAFANAPAASFRTMAGQIRDRIKNSPEYQKDHARGQGLDAAARTTSTIEAENAGKDVKADTVYTTETARRKAEAEQLGTKPQTPDQVAADKLQREALEESKRRTAAAEGARTDAASARKEDKNRSWITDYGNKHIKQIDTASLVDELDDVIAAAEQSKKLPPGLGVEQLKEGADKYPLGQTLRGIAGLVGDEEYNRFQSEADFNRKLLNRLAESVYRIDTGASGNEREEMRAAIASATNPLATLDDIKNSLRILRARLTSQLGNAAAAAPDLAAQSLSGGNIRDPKRWLGHLQPSAAVSDSALPPPPAAGDSLPTTDQKPNQVPTVKNYLDLNDEDEDLGVSYGR